MKQINQRRSFLKKITVGSVGAMVAPVSMLQASEEKMVAEDKALPPDDEVIKGRTYNGEYKAGYLNRIAFPVGGLGAGMFCLEGSGAISNMSVCNKPDVYNEPSMFAAIHIKGATQTTKVLEGQVPEWKLFGPKGTGLGAAGSTYGLPRFSSASFVARFPFAKIVLTDKEMPLSVSMNAWSPFIPGDADNSSLPVGAIEYEFRNTGTKSIDAIFSYNSKNFFSSEENTDTSIAGMKNGFVLKRAATKEKPFLDSSFAIFTDDDSTVVDHCWFRGGWWDPFTMAWNNVRDGKMEATAPVDKSAPGASLFVPVKLSPGATKTIRLYFSWYVPDSDLQIGEVMTDEKKDCVAANGCCGSPGDLGVINGKGSSSPTYKPWYSGRFENINAVTDYWRTSYSDLRSKTNLFTKAFYASTLPAVVTEAVAANLTILKSPTVLRQYDGRLWAWEGCGDDSGSCHGSCTHVWNYAQAVPHLFPDLERTLRNTEFCENQNKEGHQGFRTNLPISPLKHDFHAASDGQLGGIMKVHREWRISGDTAWMERIFPMVKVSMDYCIRTWDPRHRGVLEEPHHNTYDIEFWGPDGMCTSFYLGALQSIITMGGYLHQDISKYQELYDKGRTYMETSLYNGQYFFQRIEYKELDAPNPAKALSFGGDYSAEAVQILQKEGPKYQYGTGCLSDGVLGAWIANMCGLDHVVDDKKLSSHLLAVHQYNLKKDLRDHANPQRPGYAVGHEGGLLLCTWPRGGKLSLPFVYSDEVWTGIEYQVASHLMVMGKVKEGLDVVKYCRDRYDGRVRNPFNEYECGQWYARAMSSYGLIQGLTGLRYDAVDKTLYAKSGVDFTAFISTATGFGTVTMKSGKPKLDVVYGKIDVEKTVMIS